MGLCKFCGQEKKLIDAHIIPKKFFTGLKNDKYLDINTKTGKYKILQKGNYDSNILCGECDDNILGEFDKEGYRVLLSNFSEHEKKLIPPEYAIYKVYNDSFDYTKLRNFFISVLWRASVSTSMEWKCINLGAYEKKALEILKGKKEYDELFKILIYKNMFDNDLNQQVCVSKMKNKMYKAFLIQMAGYFIKIIVDSRKLSQEFKIKYERYFLCSENVYIIETPDVDKLNYNNFQIQLKKLHDIGFSLQPSKK